MGKTTTTQKLTTINSTTTKNAEMKLQRTRVECKGTETNKDDLQAQDAHAVCRAGGFWDAGKELQTTSVTLDGNTGVTLSIYSDCH